MKSPFANSPFRHMESICDFCVVGGGLAGIAAALAAARRGAKTTLIQDRPILGGNSSSEIGVHVIGADCVGQYPHMRETGILEEMRLNNIFRNPQAELSMWDLVLYDLCLREPNLTLLLNCPILHGECADGILMSVTGWQLTTQTWHTVTARIFADCSGDAILAPITGAACRHGREGRAEFNESHAPETPDTKTMGLAQIYYTRDYGRPMEFRPFDWARKTTSCDDYPWGADNHAEMLYSPWWCELGGESDTIHDSERIRDEILRLNLGLWDHIKNGNCVHRQAAANRAISQLCFVSGRRESRRYEGLHLLTENDIMTGGQFDDVVAYGGWTLDDHHPAGVDSFARFGEPPNHHFAVPVPYGIPFRSLVSREIRNLMFAGRVASCTHIAMSSTRVMGTCASMGQAVGTAAAEAVRRKMLPADLLASIGTVQQHLLRDDAYLPGIRQQIDRVTREATFEVPRNDAEKLRDGIQRQVANDPHAIVMQPGESVTCRFRKEEEIRAVSLTLDSAMERSIAFRGPGWQEPLPKELPRSFLVEAEMDGTWRPIYEEPDNWHRHRLIPLATRATAVRYTLLSAWGAPESQLYGFLLNPEEP